MNSNDFERELRRQELRKIPDEWRGQILGNAIAVTEAPGTDSRELTFAATVGKWWRQLLWPCPQAWAGLAAVWLIIWTLHLSSPRQADLVEARARRPAPELLAAVIERRRLLAELIAPSPAATPTPSPAPKPRSGRRSACAAV